MFRTFKNAEVQQRALLGYDFQLWRYVEQGSHRPWFYVTLVEIDDEVDLRKMLMLPDVQTLEELLASQTDTMYVESVLLVSPSHLNHTNRWQMEPLLKLERLIAEESYALVYEVVKNRYVESYLNYSDLTVTQRELIYAVS